VQLTATIIPANTSNKTVQWLSSNNNILNVSSTGLVTARNRGMAMIGAFTTDGSKKYSIAYINVLPSMSMPKGLY
jgi:uncharacterized protein YjdB